MKAKAPARRVFFEEHVGVYQRLEVLVTDDGECRVHVSLGPIRTSDRQWVRRMWQSLKAAEEAMAQHDVSEQPTLWEAS